jgi:heptosyltransferase-2
MMATPVLSAVRNAFPKAKISILAKPHFASFWRSFKEVHEVLLIQKGLAGYARTAHEIKKRGFDAALTLPSSFSSAFLLFAAGVPHRAGWGGEGRDLFLTRVVPNPMPRHKHLVWEFLELTREGLGRPTTQKSFRLQAPEEKTAQKDAKLLFKELALKDRKGFIALGPGATYGPAKRWPLVHWKQLIDKLLKTRPETLLVLGGAEEEAYLAELFGHGQQVVSLVGRTTPSTLAAILKECKVLITNDTGPMHVAAAVGTPTVALFGSTSPTWTRPFGEGHEVIYKQAECSPCFQKTCPIGYICLSRIAVDEVFGAALKSLKGKGEVKAEMPPQEAAV